MAVMIIIVMIGIVVVIALRSHLSLDHVYLLKSDHSVFGSHWWR